MKKHVFTLVLISLLGSLQVAFGAADIYPTHLRCEYRENPFGIDVKLPRLSWKVAAVDTSQRGLQQTAYQILVATTPEKLAANQGDLWDSGKVNSDETLHVEYVGKPLLSRTQCYWKVRVWDHQDQPSPWSKPSMWSMGLLKPSDWKAKWIADLAATKRYLATPHNGYLSTFLWPLAEPSEPHTNTANDPQWIVVDLGKTEKIDCVRLFPARPYGRWTEDTGFLYPVRMKIEVAQKSDFSDAKTVVDKTDKDIPRPGPDPVDYRFDPTEARFVRLVATHLRQSTGNPPNFLGDRFGLALAEMQVLAGEKNLAAGAKVSALNTVEEGGWSLKNLVDGRTETSKGGTTERWPGSMVRKEFYVDGDICRATVYATARGLYELRINGQRVSDQLLAPEWTDYNKRIQVQTQDVTTLLKKGGNAVGAMLGDGWYAGRLGNPPPPGRGYYGVYPEFCMQLEVELADGRRQVICSDSTWRGTDKGPIRYAGIFDGEEYDAQREMPGWDQANFDESQWQEVVAKPLDQVKLAWQRNEPIRVVKELKPLKLTEPKPGMYVFDFGQNMVGWARIKLQGSAGTTVKIRYAEAANPDGTIYTANLRSAKQTDLYTLRGDEEEVFEPHFTYHGFRYVEVTGLPNAPKQEDLIGRVFHSSSPDAGKFTCSNDLLNKIMHCIEWVQRSNMHSVATDCPQRDERLGWTGDIQAFSQTSIFNMDMAGFFSKWVMDMRDDQADDGRFPNYVPHPYDSNKTYSGAPAWGDAGIIIPWRVYENYADKRLLEEHFLAAKRWIGFIQKYNPEMLWLQKRDEDFGDWLNGDTVRIDGYPGGISQVPKEVLASAFYAHSTELVAKMATVLGKKEEAEKYSKLSEGIKAAFNKAYVDAEGRIKGDTQAGYALALHFNLLPEPMRQKAMEHLTEAIKKYNNHLSTGMQTTHRLMLELSRNGRHDEAYRLINLRNVPSWGYMVDQGATTIWERWDGYVEGRGFQNPGMNSLNHWALGAVGEWVWRNLAGINPDENQPGYKHFVIHPRPSQDLTWVKATYDSIRGPIVVDWKQADGKFDLHVEIPVNTTATVYVPTQSETSVTEGDGLASKAQGIQFLRMEDGAAVYKVVSGKYRFESKIK